MNLHFTKMHGLGNDFIIIDDREAKLKRLSQLAKKLCDRRFGVGADQLLLLSHSGSADYKMRTFNADGSEVEMCGNGIRCLGKYIWETILRCDESVYAIKYCQTIDSLTIETIAGIMEVHKTGNLFRVDMGEPLFEPEAIPVDSSQLTMGIKKGKILNNLINVDGKAFKMTCVCMGNPHAVIVVKDVGKLPVGHYGPLIENHRAFPNRTNVEFIQVVNEKNIKMRVWERGSGETMACGTGAAASAVASFLKGLTGRKVNVHLLAGRLSIEWSAKNNHVYMTGPAVNVFEGTINI